MSKTLFKMFTVVLLAASVHAGVASAHGGGPAETMPGISFPDLPSYRPEPRCFASSKSRARHTRHYGTGCGD